MKNITNGKLLNQIKPITEDNNIDFSDIIKDREIKIKNIRKNKIRNEIFFKKKNNNDQSINNSFINNDIIIQNLNIDSQLKNEKYINDLLYSNNFNKIFEYIKEIYNNNDNFNLDKLKYGLYLLNEKFLNLEDKTILQKDNFIDDNTFKEIIFMLLMYAKNEGKKIDYDPIILKLTYQILANFCFYCSNDIDTAFLFDEKYFELHIYFLNSISDISIINNILLMTYNICLDDNILTNKIFTYNNNRFITLLIEYVNNYQNDNKRIEIIIDLFICYINIFNNYDNKIQKKKHENKDKDNIIEMKDNTIKIEWNIIENIYDISLLLIYKKNNIFNNILYIIGSIFKIIYKFECFELMSKIIINNNTKLMLLFILEKDYSEDPYDLIYISDIIRYIIKSHSKASSSLELKNNIINLINDIEENLNEYDEIIDIFIYLLSIKKKLKLKDNIIIKLIEIISSFIKDIYFYRNIIENKKQIIINLIFEYINSSNYKIRKKIINILEYITNKKDFFLSDDLVKNKILYYIKNAIDPSITYCNDEKMILTSLKIISNLLSLGEIVKKLYGVNCVLNDFENIGGKELLDNLMCNKSELIYNTSSELFERYFN